MFSLLSLHWRVCVTELCHDCASCYHESRTILRQPYVVRATVVPGILRCRAAWRWPPLPRHRAPPQQRGCLRGHAAASNPHQQVSLQRKQNIVQMLFNPIKIVCTCAEIRSNIQHNRLEHYDVTLSGAVVCSCHSYGRVLASCAVPPLSAVPPSVIVGLQSDSASIMSRMRNVRTIIRTLAHFGQTYHTLPTCWYSVFYIYIVLSLISWTVATIHRSFQSRK